MKIIMTGNEAVARGAYEAGCHVAAAYPGTPSTEILENISNYKEIDSEWAPNEKVALEVACGASIAGGRALAAMKHVGLNVAADPLFTIAYEGVNGGLVVVTADDPGCHSSQNEQDNRLYAPAARLVLLEPSDSQECKDFTKLAFAVSEQFDTPVLLRLTTRVCHSKSLVELEDRLEAPVKPYIKNADKYICTPAIARLRHVVVEKNMLSLKEYSENSPLNRIEWGAKKTGIITSGISYQYAKEVFGEEASYLKIGMSHPLPDRLIGDFAQGVEKIYVIEENDPYLEKHIKSLGINCFGKGSIPVCGELNPEIIKKALLSATGETGYTTALKAPSRPPVLCAGCPHRGMFYALSKYKDAVVAGDIGCYTLGTVPPLSVTDTVICMGASITAAIGMEKIARREGRKTKVFSCIGDSTFFHSGITGLVDVVYNKSNIVVVILDNSITAMTGHQENPGSGKTLMGEIAQVVDIEKIVRAVGIKENNIRVVDPYDLAATEKAVRDAYGAAEAFVIISKQPCALLKSVQKKRAGLSYAVDQKKCKKCKACMKIGCPAVSNKNGEIKIDKTQCNACSLCAQMCKFDAINKVGE